MDRTAPIEKPIAVVQPLRKKLEVFLDLSGDERDCIASLERDGEMFSRGDSIIEEGDPHGDIYIIQKGWCMMSRSLSDGRRQVTSFSLPGDFLCFNAGLFKYATRSITALTEVNLCRMAADDLVAVFAGQPRLAAAFAWCNAQDESVLAERLTSVGRRSAYERVAHLFVELSRRLELLDLTENGKFVLPVTREQLADAMGLSTLHLYRTLRRLYQDQLVGLQPQGVQILDMDGLKRAAKFEDDYLHYTQIPEYTARLLKGMEAAPDAAA